MTRLVIVHEDAQTLADAAAARLVDALAACQAVRGSASLVLTGGRIGTAILAAVALHTNHRAVDWDRIDVWWGDERFLPSGHPDRNETQARSALLDTLSTSPERLHPMPASDGPDGPDVDAGARRYADELRSAAGPRGAHETLVPPFDLLLLGVGPDAHVASLFPGTAGVRTTTRTVVGVHEAPKPPPTRVSLTLPAINRADEIWLLVSGAEKADAVAAALDGADPHQVPAAGVRGRSRTRWLLDQAAASSVPAGITIDRV